MSTTSTASPSSPDSLVVSSRPPKPAPRTRTRIIFSSPAVCFSLIQVGRFTCVPVSVPRGVPALYPVPPDGLGPAAGSPGCDLPDREQGLERSGHRGRTIGAGLGDLLEAIAERATVVGVAEAEGADGERPRGNLVPAVSQENCHDRRRSHRQLARAVHTATASGVSRTAWRSSSATCVWPLVSASDSGVPPQRSRGWGSAPRASR